MAAGADKTVRILNEHQLPWADLPGPAAEDQQRLLGPPLRDPETGMALLEFDCGPARAAPVVQQPALLLDHMAPLPELPAVDGIYSSAAFVPADSVRHIALRARLQCQAAYNLSWQADSACARVFSVSDAWFNSNFLSCVSCSRHRANSGSTTRAGNPTRNTTISRSVDWNSGRLRPCLRWQALTLFWQSCRTICSYRSCQVSDLHERGGVGMISSVGMLKNAINGIGRLPIVPGR